MQDRIFVDWLEIVLRSVLIAFDERAAKVSGSERVIR